MPIATLALLAVASVSAQQPAENWTLRQPFTADDLVAPEIGAW